MKKFVILLITCIAMVQTSFAATSALTESLLEYNAITNAIGSDPNFQNVIPVDEFIVDIKRLTKRIDILGTVKYGIITRTVTADNNQDDSRSKHRKRNRPHRYIATLNVAQNPGVGPNIITVVSIVPVSSHHCH